jgi:hypothetical protein
MKDAGGGDYWPDEWDPLKTKPDESHLTTHHDHGGAAALIGVAPRRRLTVLVSSNRRLSLGPARRGPCRATNQDWGCTIRNKDGMIANMQSWL